MKNPRGFTIVELLVVIVIIGTLASIGFISYGSYQKSITIAQLKSDLNGAATVMENARTFNNAYPADINAVESFEPTKDANGIAVTTLSGGSADGGKTYCIDAENSDSSIHYYIDSNNGTQGAQDGSCALSHPAPDHLVATIASNTSLNVSWDAVAGASNYTLQRDTTASFTSPIIISQTGTTYLSTGLTQGANYYYRVNATTADLIGGWSDTANANTSITNPSSSPVVAVTLSGGNVLATVTNSSSITCSAVGSVVQYRFRNHLNDSSTWTDYNDADWSTTLTTAQAASQGFKYGYQAQARCYKDSSTYGSYVTGPEGPNYIHPIDVPNAPSVTYSSPDWADTTYSWGSSCPTGTTPTYQYYYWRADGYNTGWISYGSGTSAIYTTAHFGWWYNLQTQVKCSNSYATSGWSASGSTSYTRPVPTIQILLVAGGGGGGGGNSTGNGGGGGAGGYIWTNYTVYNQAYGVTVGGGGSGGVPGDAGGRGSDSVFDALHTYGGGGGGGASRNRGNAVDNTYTDQYLNGGSGGGSAATGCDDRYHGGGAGVYNTGYFVASTAQGRDGGGTSPACYQGAGGGGGAIGEGGGGASSGHGGNGGTGLDSAITGSSLQYAGGGGGSINSGKVQGIGAYGGGNGNTGSGGAGAANTGSGGGGKGPSGSTGGAGGSGVVVIRYNGAALGASGGSTAYWNGSDIVQIFYGSGAFQIYG